MPQRPRDSDNLLADLDARAPRRRESSASTRATIVGLCSHRRPESWPAPTTPVVWRRVGGDLRRYDPRTGQAWTNGIAPGHEACGTASAIDPGAGSASPSEGRRPGREKPWLVLPEVEGLSSFPRASSGPLRRRQGGSSCLHPVSCDHSFGANRVLTRVKLCLSKLTAASNLHLAPDAPERAAEACFSRVPGHAEEVSAA